MVVKPFSHLVRRSTKVLAHHAQSITAASSTSTSQHFEKYSQYRFGKPNHQQRESFHSTPLSAQARPATSQDHQHDGLETYAAAWQKHQHGDEWHQFQLNQRIGWKPSRNEARTKSATNDGVSSGKGVGVDRAYSASNTTSANDQTPKEAEAAAREEAAAIAEVDAAIAQEIKDHHSQAQAVAEAAEENGDVLKTVIDHPVFQHSTPPRARSASPALSRDPPTPASSVESIGSSQYVDHIVYLEKSGSYAQIPAVFEALLRRGATPPAPAYNSLIAAAIRLPNSSQQVVSRVLDAYADMLRRNVLPDKTTFSLVLEVLAVRATQVKAAMIDLEQSRSRFAPAGTPEAFSLRSQETEYEILREDDSLAKAVKVFDMAMNIMPEISFSAGTYRVLIEASALNGDLDQMLRFHGHMESRSIVPYASIYPAMITAFATSGDLASAVETYEGYKVMATEDDVGEAKLLDRTDEIVYTALVNSYLACGMEQGASNFFAKLGSDDSFSQIQIERLNRARDAVVVGAFVTAKVNANQFESALEFVQNQAITVEAKQVAFSRISTAAADNNAMDTANNAYGMVKGTPFAAFAQSALLAMNLRNGNIPAAKESWSELASVPSPTRSLIEPATLFAITLAKNGDAEEGLFQAMQAFSSIRTAEKDPKAQLETMELIDEAIEYIASTFEKTSINLSARGSLTLMWTMVENGGLLPAVAEQLLASIGPEDVVSLSWQDLKLALQVEAGIVASGSAKLDIAHNARLAHMLETAVAMRMSVDPRTAEVVGRSLASLGVDRPDLVTQWQAFVYTQAQQEFVPPMTPISPAMQQQPAQFTDTFDPHGSSLDQRGSALIVDELENASTNSSVSLNEALARFKNMRRVGRHPRYIAYAKLISAAAKDGRHSLIQDLFEMAKQDVPLLMQYPVVRHGWVSILDAMVGANLTTGNRHMAAEYHQQLRDIGASPSANTFGLYITTLKESTKTFDEATEAVKIFQQAKFEGVEPSSFLYNALIGKLGKARRIDDCLLYFAEMRNKGIRPTSVTYGTIVNALCRVSDERFAQDLFDEMESMPNYKPRPAPYNSMMQFFLTTKRDSSKVLEYYQRMRSRNIQPTMHTYKLLIDTHATLEPVNLPAAEAVLDTIRSIGQRPEAVHYASLIHAKGCVLQDLTEARKTFDYAVNEAGIRPQACLYQALFESMVAGHAVKDTEPLLEHMIRRGVKMTPYIANTLIHGWALDKDISRAKSIYASLGTANREPSTYEAMTRAFLAAQDRASASEVVQEMLTRGYPSAVSGKILELLGHGISSEDASAAPTTDMPAIVEAMA